MRGDTDRLNSVKYLFVVAAEVMIDTGQHVIATEGLEPPTSFAGVFEKLGRAGVVPHGLNGPARPSRSGQASPSTTVPTPFMLAWTTQ